MEIEYTNKKKTVIIDDLVDGKIYKDDEDDIVLVCNNEKIVVLHGFCENEIYDISDIYDHNNIFTELNCTLTIEE